jgi:hypothetical protein
MSAPSANPNEEQTYIMVIILLLVLCLCCLCFEMKALIIVETGCRSTRLGECLIACASVREVVNTVLKKLLLLSLLDW